MRRQKTQNLSEVIRTIKDKYNLNKELDKVHARQVWSEIVGPNASRYTSRLYFRDDVLYVHITSPVLRYELNNQRKTLIKRVNEKLGREVIRDVILK